MVVLHTVVVGIVGGVEFPILDDGQQLVWGQEVREGNESFLFVCRDAVVQCLVVFVGCGCNVRYVVWVEAGDGAAVCGLRFVYAVGEL